MWIPYLMRDTWRVAEMQGLPYRWPRPDPVVVDPDTRARRQRRTSPTFIALPTKLGCAAAEDGHGLPFL